jgi:hypothetical protein
MREVMRFEIAPDRFDIVEFRAPRASGRSSSFSCWATGSSSSGGATRNAVSLLTGGGPGATLAVNASTPLRLKSLRQSRTVSSRTPNASAICGLVQPDRVSSTSACTICFPAITGPRERGQSQTLFVACHHRRLAAHAPPTRIGASRESQNQRVGQTAGICLAPQPRYTGTSDPPIRSGCRRSQRRS